MRSLSLVGLLAGLLLPAAAVADGRGAPQKGVVHFRPVGDQANVPAHFRLEEHRFDYEMESKTDLPGVEVFRVRFPSPVASPHPENNTVHAEYYRPAGKGPFPGVIVLDILGGDQSLSRTVAAVLAGQKVAALFVQMAYYGPRRPPGGGVRLLSPNYTQTMAAIGQTVLDVRRASAWLEARPEVDGQRLGVMGTSLGSFLAALSAAAEPRLGRVVLALGGGGLVDAYYDHPQAAAFRTFWETLGGSRASLARLVAPADPLTYAAQLKQRRLLMIAAKRDDVVPPRMAEALWEATGKQKIVWYDTTHVGAVVYILPALGHVVDHFRAD
jgi:dienelactone hydrolase